MDRGAWWVIVLGFAKSWTWLSFYIVVGGSQSVRISHPCLTAEHTGSRTSPERLGWIVWSLKIHDATGAASTTQKSTNPKCGGLEWQGYFLDYFLKVDLTAMIHLGVHMVFRRGTLKSYTWDNTQSSSIALGEERFLELGLTAGPLGRSLVFVSISVTGQGSDWGLSISLWARRKGKISKWARGIFWKWRFFGVLESPINTVEWKSDRPTQSPEKPQDFRSCSSPSSAAISVAELVTQGR